MTSPELPIHDFKRPPINEVVVGVQFVPLNLTLLQIGQFHLSVNDVFPKTQVVAPIASQIERFDGPFQTGPMQTSPEIVVMDNFSFGRSWFLSTDQTRLIQIQRDRFLVNWRARDSIFEYPRYSSVREMFEQSYQKFLNFVDAADVGELVPVQCDVSYFNRIYPADGDFSSPSRFFTWWSGLSEKQDDIPGEAEVFSFTLQRRIIDEGGNPIGRMHIKVAPAFSPEDESRFYLVELTARAIPKSGSLEALLEAQDLCRKYIVRTFVNMTSSQMHSKWERTL